MVKIDHGALDNIHVLPVISAYYAYVWSECHQYI